MNFEQMKTEEIQDYLEECVKNAMDNHMLIDPSLGVNEASIELERRGEPQHRPSPPPKAESFLFCFKRQIMVSMPEVWTQSIRPECDFAHANGDEAYIRCGEHGAFAIVLHDGHTKKPYAVARRLTSEEINAIEWRKFGAPWSAYIEALVFGYSAYEVKLH